MVVLRKIKNVLYLFLFFFLIVFTVMPFIHYNVVMATNEITEWHDPTQNADTFNEWTDPVNAYQSNDSYAVGLSSLNSDQHDYYYFQNATGGNLIDNIPVDASSINGISVSIEAKRVGGKNSLLYVNLSWDGGSSFTSDKVNTYSSTTDVIQVYGGTSDTWGRTWSRSEFDTSNFLVCCNVDSVVAQPSTLYIDHIMVNVSYNMPYVNTPPTLSSESPANGTEDISFSPTCSIYVEDTDGNASTMDFYYSTDGSSWTHGSHSSAHQTGKLNETVTWEFTECVRPVSKYYWKVHANDTHDNVSEWYTLNTSYKKYYDYNSYVTFDCSDGNDKMSLWYSEDNGTNWNEKVVFGNTDQEFYSRRQWFDDVLFISIGDGEVDFNDKGIYAIWGTYDSIVNDGRMYATNQTPEETGYYSLPIQQSDFGSADFFPKATYGEYEGGVEIYGNDIYMLTSAGSDNRGIYIHNKTLGDESWSSVELSLLSGDDDDWIYPLGIERVHDDNWIILFGYKNTTSPKQIKIYYANSTTPMVYDSWAVTQLFTNVWNPDDGYNDVRGAIFKHHDGRLVLFAINTPRILCPNGDYGWVSEYACISVIDDRYTGSTELGVANSVGHAVTAHDVEVNSCFGNGVGQQHVLEYDPDINMTYVVYFDETDIVEPDIDTHLEIKRYDLETGNFYNGIEFENSGTTIVGENWNKNSSYEYHISAELTRDAYGHMWCSWGGHYSNTYPYKEMRSIYPINSTNFDITDTKANQWENFDTIHSGTDGAYHTQSVILSNWTWSNFAPQIKGEVPVNQSTGISLQSTCNVTVTDNEGDTMRVQWWTNESGSWLMKEEDTGVTSGQSPTWDFTDADTENTKYWWSANCTDENSWTNETYWFITKGWNIVEEINITLSNNTFFQNIQEINITLSNNTLYKDIEEWNITIQNWTVTWNHINDWNITLSNNSFYKTIEEINITISNNTIFLVVEEINITLSNSSKHNMIQDWNITLVNSSVSWQNIVDINITLSNNTLFQMVSEFNITLSNQSEYNTIQEYNITLSNSTSFNTLQEWNVTLQNQSKYQDIQEWNITISNTSVREWNDIQEWNITLQNISIAEWNIVQEWNITISNLSVGIVVSNVFPVNNSNIDFLQPTLLWDLEDSDGLSMNYSLYFGNSSENTTMFVYNTSNVVNGSYQYSNYYTATNFSSIYWWRLYVNDSVNEINETFCFTTVLASSNIISRTGFAFAIGAGGCMFGCLALIIVISRKRRKNNGRYYD